MLTLALLLLVQDPAATASPEVMSIRKACAKLAEVSGYTVQQTTLEEGGGFGGPPPAAAAPAGGEAAAATVPPAPVAVVFTAQVQKGKPTRFTQDKMEAWREGDAMVFRSGESAWERFEQPRGRGQGGGDQDLDPEAARAMRARMSLASSQVAHEMLAGLDAKIAMAAATKDGAKTVITGQFTPEGAASLGRRMGRRSGGQGGQGGQGSPPAMESSGTFRCVIAADGSLESLVFDTLTKGSFNDTPFERKRHVELKVSAVGTTTLEVPADVATKLAEKPRDPSKEF
jgi:hypothetical protein